MHRKSSVIHVGRIGCAVLFGFAVSTQAAEDTRTGTHTDRLVLEKKIEIPVEECKEIEAKLGQLFYINVDGFGTKVKAAIDPAYVRLVQELNVGGVITHFGSTDYRLIRESTRQLQQATDLPLLVGHDAVIFESTNKKEPMIGPGAGHNHGFYRAIGPVCSQRMFEVGAFLQAAVGLNQALGPAIDQDIEAPDSSKKARVVLAPMLPTYSRYGIATTLKHFPYTPKTFDLHKESRDTKLPLEKVKKRLQPFRDFINGSDFVMTTHLYNSNVDAEELATFSKKWMEKLRKDIGFEGLVMTDALFMMAGYEKAVKLMSAKWDPKEKEQIRGLETIFAARAILAGHDFVLLESSSEDTRKIFRSVHYLACQNTENGRQLRNRILESYERIKRYKDKNRQALAQQLNVPDPLIEEAIQWTADTWSKEGIRQCQQPKQPRFEKMIANIRAFEMTKRGQTASKPCSSNAVPLPAQETEDLKKQVDGALDQVAQ